MRLINLDELLTYPIRRSNYDKEHGSGEFINGVESVLEYAQEIHVYDLGNHVNRVAKWIPEGTYKTLYRCSYCGNAENYPHKFCGNCGCKMQNEKEEAEGWLYTNNHLDLIEED